MAAAPTRRAGLGCAWLLLCGLAAAAGPSRAETIVPRTARPPVLDGVLTDACWAAALQLGDFTVPESDRRPRKDVVARLCFDRQALYVAFACAEPSPERIKAAARGTKRSSKPSA